LVNIISDNVRSYNIKEGDFVKMIQAIIRAEKMDNVKKALEEKSFIAMSIFEITGRGEQKGITLEHRGKKVEVDTLPKIMIEMVVNDQDVDTIISIIRASGRTGKFGDGKIFVLPVEMVAKVRTDEVWK
jgi:nitrogen regulatory protein P-II 1